MMRILAIGAHPDDIEFGCGGFLMRAVRAKHKATMLVLSCEAHKRYEEQQKSAKLIGANLIYGKMEDRNIMEYHVRELVEETIKEYQIDTVLTHYTDDTHQDHSITARGTISAARYVPRVLLYHSFSTLHFIPQIFLTFTPSEFSEKLGLIKTHISQITNRRNMLTAAFALTSYHGFLAKTKYAEGFAVNRFQWVI